MWGTSTIYRLKAIYYDGSGLVLVAKRIERGSFMSITELSESREISLADLKLIFHGSILRKPNLERSMVSASVKKENNIKYF